MKQVLVLFILCFLIFSSPLFAETEDIVVDADQATSDSLPEEFLRSLKSPDSQLLCRWSPASPPPPSFLTANRIAYTPPVEKKAPTSPKPLPISPQQVPGEQALTAIDFENGVQLKFREWPEWRLVKLNENLYSLKLSNCSLASKELALTYFAPSTIQGITRVVPRSTNNQTRIQIHVEPGTELTGSVQGTTLTLSTE